MSIFNHFPHLTLNSDQQNAMEKIQAFLQSEDKVFLLKGYAGSGKTTLLKGVVDYLEDAGKKFQLMAPTGRASKVIHQKTGKIASTIHKGIYSFKNVEEINDKDGEETGRLIYRYKININENISGSVLIIDEASMISDVESVRETVVFGSGYLLSDLFEYARILEPGNGTKIIFIGDPAQLPPVGMNFSPAMQEEYIEEKFNICANTAELKLVMRQETDNGILNAATLLRNSMNAGYFNDFDLRENGKDIINPAFGNFLKEYKDAGSSKIVITYSNKAAQLINAIIRKEKYGDDLPVQEGDVMISGANNYAGGVLNGEFAVVATVSPNPLKREVAIKDKGKVELVWRAVEFVFPDDHEKTVCGYILENFLYDDNQTDLLVQQALQIDFRKRFPILKPGSPEFLIQMKSDKYCNPLKMKFGYAVTCHKAQGGEWEKVFVFWDYGVFGDVNFFEIVQDKNGRTHDGFYRWAYTAITRASKNLYCINPPYFNSFSGMAFVGAAAQSTLTDISGSSAQHEEIELTQELNEILQQYGLSNENKILQDHFLKTRHKLEKGLVEVIAWTKKGQYEVWYSCKRDEEKAAFKDWFDGSYEFKEKYTLIPNQTNSPGLFQEIVQLLKAPSLINISRNRTDSILDKIIFDYHIEESKPFLKALFDKLSELCNDKQITIKEIKHNDWHDRYWFEKKESKATINFYYNQKGFFGRVEPILKECNNPHLLIEFRKIIDHLKAS